jgi:K+-transporting ATPase KdpF subunit
MIARSRAPPAPSLNRGYLARGRTMGLTAALTQNLGLWVFTLVTVGLIVYLLYAMLNPTRF